MDVIDATFQILLVAASMFVKTTLPDRPLSFGLATCVGGNIRAPTVQLRFGKIHFDQPPAA